MRERERLLQMKSFEKAFNMEGNFKATVYWSVEWA